MNKKIFSLICVLFFTLSAFSQVEKMVGRWKTIDDKDGTTKSIVLIFKASNNKYYGKIEKLFKNPDRKCDACEGANKNKPLVGMTIISHLEKKNGKLTNGTILDPMNGKVYNCNMNLDSETGNLKVRGSLDKNGWIGRSQTWLPVR
ncbi:MAG: hypothetical protein AUK44_00495 [Porphyromonadaceae bacterium CG2_30_38_12]|nr:MAG: hypothetical protein AUK44_00495 [Porphyromonadaceae bacterium CG2_30_38_12]